MSQSCVLCHTEIDANTFQTDATAAAGMTDYSSSAKEWVRLSVGSCLATIKKASSEAKLVVDASPISKTGTWKLSSDVLDKIGFSEYIIKAEYS